MDIRLNFELNNKHIIYKNLWDAPKAKLRANLICIR